MSLYSWQYVRDADTRVIADVQLFLFTASSLLTFMALASVAVLIGGRMAEQTHRIGLLKAIGGTLPLIAMVVLFEYALIGLIGAGMGLAVGRLVAPSVDGPGASLLGAPAGPSLDPATIGSVIALALVVAIAGTFMPALRAAHQTTVSAFEDSARAPRRRAFVIKLSAHLPAPLLLGARLATRRPRRLLST